MVVEVDNLHPDSDVIVVTTHRYNPETDLVETDLKITVSRDQNGRVCVCVEEDGEKPQRSYLGENGVDVWISPATSKE